MTTNVFSYRPAACFEVHGEDAGNYLQGQFSNELRQAAGSVVYGLFLNHKGKVVADAHVLKLTEQAFLVTSCFSVADVVKRRLEEFVVADDVVLDDLSPMTHGLSMWGPQCGRILQQRIQPVPQPGQFVQSNDLLVFAGRRTKGENFEIMGPGQLIGPLCEQMRAQGCIEAETNQTEHLRITQGIPAIPWDIGPGDLPNEGNLEEEAISYTKGCYLGQEVMARLKNMGQVRRRLFVVRGIGAPPEARTPLFQQERKIGEIRSVAGRDGEFVAMAMLSLPGLNETAGLSLAPDVAPTLKIHPRG